MVLFGAKRVTVAIICHSRFFHVSSKSLMLSRLRVFHGWDMGCGPGPLDTSQVGQSWDVWRCKATGCFNPNSNFGTLLISYLGWLISKPFGLLIVQQPGLVWCMISFYRVSKMSEKGSFCYVHTLLLTVTPVKVTLRIQSWASVAFNATELWDRALGHVLNKVWHHHKYWKCPIKVTLTCSDIVLLSQHCHSKYDALYNHWVRYVCVSSLSNICPCPKIVQVMTNCRVSRLNMKKYSFPSLSTVSLASKTKK